MDRFLRLSRVILISLIVFPWLVAASELEHSTSQIAGAPDWAQGEGIRAYFAQSEHFASVHASTVDQIIAAIITANTDNRPGADRDAVRAARPLQPARSQPAKPLG